MEKVIPIIFSPTPYGFCVATLGMLVVGFTAMISTLLEPADEDWWLDRKKYLLRRKHDIVMTQYLAWVTKFLSVLAVLDIARIITGRILI